MAGGPSAGGMGALEVWGLTYSLGSILGPLILGDSCIVSSLGL